MRRTAKFLTSVSCAMLLAACSSNEPTTTERTGTLVFIDDGAVQCEPGSQSLQETAKILNEQGIEVLNSQCGNLTGMAFAAMCGGKTSGIHLHTITKSQLAVAAELGFASAASLANDEGLGYEIVPCPEITQ